MASNAARRNLDAEAPLREVVAAFTAAVQKLSAGQRGQLFVHRREMPKFVSSIIAQLEAPAGSGLLPTEGEGVGTLLTAAEGRRRLSPLVQPLALEEWAGPVAGPSDLERSQGIARSTLHAWQKQGLVIGLLKSARHHVFPLAQFIDGRPIQGVDAVLAAIGDPRTAWLWLVTEHPELSGKKPIDRLKAGAIHVVSDLAGRDFGQS